jgi:hypothetical protein
MDYTIYPFEGVGAVKFGMTPQQIHEIWGEPEETLMANPKFYRNHTDVYCKASVQVHYNELGVCEYISLCSDVDDDPWNEEDDDEYDSYEDTFQYDQTGDKLSISNEDKADYDKMERGKSHTLVEISMHSDDLDHAIKPTFQGRELSGQTMGELKSWFKGLGTVIQHTDEGLIFLRFGISVHSPYYVLPHQDPDRPVETVLALSSEYVVGFSDSAMKDGFPREEAITLP